MSNITDRRDHLEATGTEMQSTLEGLSWKLEEACLHLDAKGDPSEIADGIQYAEGAYRAVAAELEEVAEQLRSAAVENEGST